MWSVHNLSLRPEDLSRGQHFTLTWSWGDQASTQKKKKKIFHRIKNRPWPGCCILPVASVWLRGLVGSSSSVFHMRFEETEALLPGPCKAVLLAGRVQDVCFCSGRARRHQHQLALIRRPGLAGVAATFMSGILMPTECWDTAAVTTELTSGVGRGRGLGNYKCLMCPMSRFITTT